MAKSLHELVENYTEITPKLHARNATRAALIARALRAAANSGRRGCRVFCVQFWRNVGVIFNDIVQEIVHQQKGP